MDISKNKHSIALIFSFGDKKFLFSGDLENQTISEYTDNTIPSNLDFLKILHHGSKSSDKLLDYIEHNDIANVTAYNKGKSCDPNIDILNKYFNISDHLYSTSSLNKKDKEGKYGVVKTVFNIINNKYSVYMFGGCL